MSSDSLDREASRHSPWIEDISTARLEKINVCDSAVEAKQKVERSEKWKSGKVRIVRLLLSEIWLYAEGSSS